MISCRVLGPVEVSFEGGPAPAELLWRKNLALLVYLARSPKRARSRDHLIGLLWGDKPDSAARHSLNEAVRVLRKHVGADAIETEGEQVRLAPGAIELDVESLEARVAEDDWEGAAALVAGEFLEGFSVPGCSELEDWLHAERFGFRQTSVAVLVARATELLDAGQVRESMVVARRAQALDGTSEAAARVAMRASAIAGDRSGALAIYDALARRLDEELGAEPAEETSELAERVRRERVWQLPEEYAAGEASSGARRAPLVGREAELEELLQAWSDCIGRSRATAGMIDGDPGVGRTRLAEELLARARLDGATVATARAVEADSGEAWSGAWALAAAIPIAAAGLDEAHPASRAALAARLPAWAERFGSAADAETPTPGRALIEVARALTKRQPLVVLVDDAQWLDRDTLLALGAALRDLKGAPFFLCVTSTYPRRPELEEIRAHVGRELAGVSVQLGPLSHADLRRLARWALPSYDDVELDRVTRRVATDSAGLPLLATELLGAVALGLDLGVTQGAWPEPLRTLDQTLPGDLPIAVSAAVRVSFRRLTPEAQATLAAAAVLDERVDRATLAKATGLDAKALAAALDELEWARWLSADARGYSFVARIVRDVVRRDMLTPGQRQRILEAAGKSPANKARNKSRTVV
ncbi:MAG: AAA family ATPase [Gemmatimonadetes bacterium]|uniref:AAA family ATPase n=1 Tax=Candidatus Kutchimonas denitrificans TaxID=3056748 RepID=A0AAE5CAY9_9BACT|nr:AAA family ATPase [Gemmatimonadota bacterium]NIR75107.1 AAA family ATPase [Candidatus Kutchimonas denitrificans]NIS00939.1 AAA family ATPase [Gemmatimonadota bacterium]NIT66556.1 AAA family ATPase [Gemmatimonadota bacterium]NIU52902.1 AAA family ATPase [Gemmatimonadota bacterium]